MADNAEKECGKCYYGTFILVWIISVLLIGISIGEWGRPGEDEPQPLEVQVYGKEGARQHVIQDMIHVYNGDLDSMLTMLYNPWYDCGGRQMYSHEELRAGWEEQGKDEPIAASIYADFDMSMIVVYSHEEIIQNGTLQWRIKDWGLSPGDYLVTIPYREAGTRGGWEGMDPPVNGIWSYVRVTDEGWKIVAGD